MMISFFQLTAITLSLVFLTSEAIVSAKDDIGFSFDLVHRDSPLSPFHKPSETNHERLHNSFLRSESQSLLSVGTTLVSNGPDYFINISIGTPPVEMLGMIEFQGDIIWVPCKSCGDYCSQNTPIFHTGDSSTFETIPCDASYCKQTLSSDCTDGSVCKFDYLGTGETDLGTEKFTIGSVSLPNIVFGCGSTNNYISNAQGEEGIITGMMIGLGNSPLSLVSQLKTSISGKFSYCLKPGSSSSSKMKFGTQALASTQDKVASTRLFPVFLNENVQLPGYHVQLEAISVGNKRIAYNTSRIPMEQPPQKGNMLIDFGTPLTSIDHDVFRELATALDEAFGSERVFDPHRFLPACYISKLPDSDLPVITFHFTGADLKLQPFNSFIRVEEDLVDLVCLSISHDIPTYDGSALLGNLAQRNMLVGFDIEEMTVSFMPTDCTQQ